MPRKRQIDPDIWTSEQVITLPIESRLLFIGMISHADDEGRLHGSALSLKAAIFPGDACLVEQVKSWRDNIIKNKLAIFYTVSGSEYLYLPTFRKYQYMTKTFPSKLPPPPKITEELITTNKPVNNELIIDEQHLYEVEVEVEDEVGNDIEVEDDKNSSELLTFLFTLPGWGKAQVALDKKWLAEFLQEFPEFSIKHIKACRDYHSGKTSNTKATWKNRLRNWLEKERIIKAKEAKSGTNRANSKGRELPPRDGYKTPEEHRRAGGY